MGAKEQSGRTLVFSLPGSRDRLKAYQMERITRALCRHLALQKSKYYLFVQLGCRECSSSNGTSDVLSRYKTPRGQDGRHSRNQEGVSGQGKVESIYSKRLKFRLRDFKKGTVFKYMLMKKTTLHPHLAELGSLKIYKLLTNF